MLHARYKELKVGDLPDTTTPPHFCETNDAYACNLDKFTKSHR